MKQWANLVIAAALGALAMLGVVKLAGFHRTAEAPRSSPSAAPTYIKPNEEYSTAKRLVTQAVEQAYEYNPEVACPSSVQARRGTLFTCEALIPGHGIVPVTLEVFSHLGGFIRVVGVDQRRSEVAEYQWCKTHNALQGRAACGQAYAER